VGATTTIGENNMPLGNIKMTIPVMKEAPMDEAEDKANPVGDFFATLLHSATIAHQLHFKSRSSLEHKALGKFYDEVVELVDDLIESYQGKYGIVENYPFEMELDTNSSEKFLSDLSEFVKANRYAVCPDSEIQNKIDEIQALINSTTYKIRFLK
jgi:hypothetical protein